MTKQKYLTVGEVASSVDSLIKQNIEFGEICSKVFKLWHSFMFCMANEVDYILYVVGRRDTDDVTLQFMLGGKFHV